MCLPSDYRDAVAPEPLYLEPEPVRRLVGPLGARHGCCSRMGLSRAETTGAGSVAIPQRERWLVPRLASVDLCPLASADAHDVLWLIGQMVPGVAAMADDDVVGLEHVSPVPSRKGISSDAAESA